MRILLAVIAGIGLGAVGVAALGHGGHGGNVRTINERDIAEKLGGKDSKVSFVEVTLEPGEANAPHRHPGPVFGYVLQASSNGASTRSLRKCSRRATRFTNRPAACTA